MLKQSILGFTTLAACFSITSQAFAEEDFNHRYRFPWYLGVTGGYGTTTWQGLVPSEKNLNDTMMMSTPINVTEGGAIWGVYGGYELNPYFALELSYIRYPNAKVDFSPDSLFSFEQGGLTSLNTHTETLSLMAKVMLAIPCTYARFYSGAGIAGVHRYDQIMDHWRGSPTFGLGFNLNFTDRIMGELGGVYTAGYGESQLNPAQGYYPFLYSVFLRLGYRF